MTNSRRLVSGLQGESPVFLIARDFRQLVGFVLGLPVMIQRLRFLEVRLSCHRGTGN